MSNVWDSFSQGYGIGSSMGQTARDARAYRDGGLPAVEEAAGRTGDLAGMENARLMGRRQVQFEDEHRQNAYQNLERIRPLALGALDRVAQIPVDQRAGWLNAPHIRQRFIDWGITPEQYDQAVARLSDPAQADAALTEFRSAFTQHQDPNWQLVQTPQGQQAASIDPNSGHIALGDNAVPRGGSDYLTAEELQQRGYAPNTVVMRMPDGSERVMQQPHYGRAGASSGPPAPPNGYRIIQP